MVFKTRFAYLCESLLSQKAIVHRDYTMGVDTMGVDTN